jgi:hypothetical protein
VFGIVSPPKVPAILVAYVLRAFSLIWMDFGMENMADSRIRETRIQFAFRGRMAADSRAKSPTDGSHSSTSGAGWDEQGLQMLSAHCAYQWPGRSLAVHIGMDNAASHNDEQVRSCNVGKTIMAK